MGLIGVTTTWTKVGVVTVTLVVPAMAPTVAVTVVVVLSLTVQEIIPLVVRRFTPADAQIVRERPYAATRNDFNRRAYGQNAELYDTLRKSEVSAVLDSAVVDNSSVALPAIGLSTSVHCVPSQCSMSASPF